MEKKEIYKRFPRRKLDNRSITIPDASLSARVLIDRCAKGLPVNARMSRHIPLPIDGMDRNDFETGTEEILDVSDAVAFEAELLKKQAYIAKKKEEALKAEIGSKDLEQPLNKNGEATL